MEADRLLKGYELTRVLNEEISGLKVDFGVEDSINTGSIYVRADLTKVYSTSQGILHNLKEVTIEPGERIFCQTIEKVKLSTHHYGIILPRVWQSVNNIDIISGSIDPGYTGKLWLIITNNGKNASFINSSDFLAKLLIWEGNNSNTEHDLTRHGVKQNREDIVRYLENTFGRMRIQKIRKNKIINNIFWIGLLVLTFAILFICIGLQKNNHTDYAVSVLVGYLGLLTLIISVKFKK